MIRLGLFDSTDALIAVQAGQQTANRLRKPVAIQHDLSIVLLENADQEVLEIINPE